jgi:hypothetical protein
MQQVPLKDFQGYEIVTEAPRAYIIMDVVGRIGLISTMWKRNRETHT